MTSDQPIPIEKLGLQVSDYRWVCTKCWNVFAVLFVCDKCPKCESPMLACCHMNDISNYIADSQQEKPLKMYILIKEDVDLGHAILAAAHASLSGYLTFSKVQKNTDGEGTVEDWVHNSFRKVVCKVNQKEFDKSKTYFKENVDFRIMHECGLPGNPEVAIVFAPRYEWPKFFSWLKLYK